MQQRTAINKISRIQRLACLGITGAIKTTPTAALETLLDLPPLDIFIKGEARMGAYRLQGKPRDKYENLGHNQIWNQGGVSISDTYTDHMVPKYTFNRNFGIEINDRREWNSISSKIRGSIWYTDGSKTDEGTGAGIFSETENVGLSFSLGTYTTVFQAEMYAILQCVAMNNLRAYENRRINILTDSQASLKALMSPKVTSRLVWECRQELEELAERNSVTLFWVPGHTGIDGNEKADELARNGSSTLYFGPEPALGVPKTIIRGQVREWVKNKHKEYWGNVPGQRHGRPLIREPSKRRAEELIKLHRSQLRIITGLLTGHCALKDT